MCVDDAVHELPDPFYSHLLFLSANLSTSDPFVTNTLKHLIRHAPFMAYVHRCSIFDLRTSEHENFVDRTATHWMAMLVWDSTLAVSNGAIEHFQALVKSKSFLMPVLVWVYVNPELVSNKVKRKRAVMELEKVCQEKVFKPLQVGAVWRLEIFGLEKEGRKNFSRGLAWLQQQVTFSTSKELDESLLHGSPSALVATEPSLHTVPSTLPTIHSTFPAAKGDAHFATAPFLSPNSASKRPASSNSTPNADQRVRSKPLSTLSKVKLMGFSYEAESAKLNYGVANPNDSLILTDPVTRDVQSLSATALGKAAVHNHHHPGSITPDADQSAAVQRRRMQRSLNATEAEMARLFRQRMGTASSFRSVRFADTSEDFASAASSFHDNGSVMTVTSGMSAAQGTISAANDGSFFSAQNDSFILAGRGIEYSGGQINVRHIPSVLPQPSVSQPGVNPTLSEAGSEAPESVASTFDTDVVSNMHCDIDPASRNYSVQNVYRESVPRRHLHFESAAEMRINAC